MISKTPRSLILERLREIERQHAVKVIYAAESGSRAWGFPSPDSDYDVHFIYLHERDWYLSLVERRDVIELTLDANGLDLSGWDFRKALRLFAKSNPPLHEWLVSPIVYVEEGKIAPTLRGLAKRRYSRRTMGWHYLSAAERNEKAYFGGRSDVRLKKYFYSIRPLCSVLWLIEHSDLPPMTLSALRDGIDLPASVNAAIDQLLDQKQRTVESVLVPRIDVLDGWIRTTIDRATAYYADVPPADPMLDELDEFYRRVLDTVARRAMDAPIASI